MQNGASNRKGKPSVKNLVLHSNTSYTNNDATNQAINYQLQGGSN